MVTGHICVLSVLCIVVTSVALETKELEKAFDSTNDTYNLSVTDSFHGNETRVFFENSSERESKTGELTDCEFDDSFLTCVKLTLLGKVTSALKLMKDLDKRHQSYDLFDGLMSLQHVGDESSVGDDRWGAFKEGGIGVDEKLDLLLASGISKLFQSRILSLNLVPGLSLRVRPSNRSPNLVDVIVRLNRKVADTGNNLVNKAQQRTHDLLEIQPWMLIPGAVMVGLFPYLLLQLKMMVSSAVMFNNMVLGGAILMTLRNLVFGTRPGGVIVYDNLGYKKEKPLPHNPGSAETSHQGTSSEAHAVSSANNLESSQHQNFYASPGTAVHQGASHFPAQYINPYAAEGTPFHRGNSMGFKNAQHLIPNPSASVPGQEGNTGQAAHSQDTTGGAPVHETNDHNPNQAFSPFYNMDDVVQSGGMHQITSLGNHVQSIGLPMSSAPQAGAPPAIFNYGLQQNGFTPIVTPNYPPLFGKRLLRRTNVPTRYTPVYSEHTTKRYKRT